MGFGQSRTAKRVVLQQRACSVLPRQALGIEPLPERHRTAEAQLARGADETAAGRPLVVNPFLQYKATPNSPSKAICKNAVNILRISYGGVGVSIKGEGFLCIRGPLKVLGRGGGYPKERAFQVLFLIDWGGRCQGLVLFHSVSPSGGSPPPKCFLWLAFTPAPRSHSMQLSQSRTHNMQPSQSAIRPLPPSPSRLPLRPN